MFVGAELAHFGERAGEARQRAGAALGFGALLRLDVMAADDHLDLRQFALHRARDALDQRNPNRLRRIGGTIDRGTASGPLPLADAGLRRLIRRLDRNRLGTNIDPGGGHRPPAAFYRRFPFGGQFTAHPPCGFFCRGFVFLRYLLLRGCFLRGHFVFHRAFARHSSALARLLRRSGCACHCHRCKSVISGHALARTQSPEVQEPKFAFAASGDAYGPIRSVGRNKRGALRHRRRNARRCASLIAPYGLH